MHPSRRTRTSPRALALCLSVTARADFAGYHFRLGKLDEFDGNWRAAEMVEAFVSSTEYRKRFAAP